MAILRINVSGTGKCNGSKKVKSKRLTGKPVCISLDSVNRNLNLDLLPNALLLSRAAVGF